MFTGLFLGEAVFPRQGGIFDSSIDASSAGAGSGEKSAKQLYDGACLACHTSGVAGALKVGDSTAWESRMADGLDGLTSSAINGKDATLPNGGSVYRADEIRKIIEFMLGESGF